MNHLAGLTLLLVASLSACGPKPQIHSTGSVAARSEFAFKNFVVVEVAAPTATYSWSEFNVRDGNAFRVPYAELRVQLASGEVLVTDENTVNGQLLFDATLRSGTRFRLNANGSVDVLAP